MPNDPLTRWLPVIVQRREHRRALLGALAGLATLDALPAAAKRRKKKRKKKHKHRCASGLTGFASRCAQACDTSATCGQAFCRVTYDGLEGPRVCAFFNFTGDCAALTSCGAHAACGENELCVVFEPCTITACGQVGFG